MTALFIACANGEKEMVECVVKHGCDIWKKDGEGRTGLFGAVCGGHLNVVRYVVENGGRVGDVDRKGKKVIDVGRLLGDMRIVEYLSLHGGSENTREGEGEGNKEGLSREGDIKLDDESRLYRFIIQHHRMPNFTTCYCDECGHQLMEHENRYRCLECVDFDLCEECHHKTEFTSPKGHNTTHRCEQYVGE